MFNVAGISFRLYGLLIGVALLVGFNLVQLQAKIHKISQDALETAALWAIGGGVVGARLYHVATDFYLYQHDLWQIFYLWRGGLSIIGAIMGGVIGIWVGRKWGFITVSLPVLMDLSVFGLPVAQAIGRLGNFINQELYGLPTTLPWGIYIDPDKRTEAFTQVDRFHPLFLYEMIATLVFAVFIWWYAKRSNGNHPLGSLAYFSWYLMYYSAIRFILDFIRVEKAVSVIPGLGLNQLVMIGTFLVGVWLWRKSKTYAA